MCAWLEWVPIIARRHIRAEMRICMNGRTPLSNGYDCFAANAALVRLILDTGVDLSGTPERSPMDCMIHRLCPTMDPTWPIRDSPREALKCIRLLAEAGVLWQPTQNTKFFLRQSISRAGSASFPYLRDLLDTGGVGPVAFRELMKTDRMREVLGHDGRGVEMLREAAGWRTSRRKVVKARRRRTGRREPT